ncbi:MAG TPA: hypothetical protein PKU97_13340, partial [Kofleriaceae bacterium]|nr:hypothetical protein [Kofleriaceae bacterium]
AHTRGQPDVFDLDEAAARDNQAALDSEAHSLGIGPGRVRPATIDSETEAIVAGTIDLLLPAPTVPLAQQSEDELMTALADAASRVAASEELCRRGASFAAAAVVAALVHMSRPDAAQILAQALRLGIAVERPLIGALSSSKVHLRQGAALALGVLATDDGISAIVDLLLIEPTEIWREVARAVGQVGPSALAPLARAVEQRGITARVEERIGWAMAYLGARDCRRAVGQMSSGHSIMAPIAAKALALVEPAHRDQLQLMESTALDPQRAFSQQFFRCLSPKGQPAALRPVSAIT